MQQPARILTSYYRPKPGGLCKRYFRGIKALLDSGHEVHYLSVEKFPIDHQNCYFHRFPWPAGNTESLLFWACFHILSPFFLVYFGFRYRITHAFAFGATYALLLQPVCAVKRIPITLFLRGDAIKSHRIKQRSSWIVWLDVQLEGLAMHRARVYAVSQSLRLQVLARHSNIGSAQIGVLKNDLGPLNPRRRREFSLPLLLACVGVLEEEKNQMFLLKCLNKIDISSFRLEFFGIGSQMLALQRMALHYGISDRVHFNGWVDSGAFWTEIDVLVAPSLHEGAPNAVLEALAHDVPILASDIPGHREVLPEKSLLPLDDPQAWLSCIRTIIDAPDRELCRLLESQREVAGAYVFDWDAEICKRIIMSSGN